MNIKDSILTGFGAAMLAIRGSDCSVEVVRNQDRLYKEPEPDITFPESDFASCLFYVGTEDPGAAIFYEYMSAKFIDMARELARSEKTVYVVTKNMVTPSYGELIFEEARREGVIFINLEEGEAVDLDNGRARITGLTRDFLLDVDRVVRFDDYKDLFKDREFLSLYRSEPQLRWSPTKWGRKKYHVGFIRHPRDKRWEAREVLGALGEMILDREEERVLPEVNEERCSGCGSCKDACPHSAIEMEFRERQIAVFGPHASSSVPIAHVKEDTCVGCGLCASTCPSDVISHTP
jgi:Pyruvate/2-oxoacid:ferredoxin oxidoreductase delta subunit